MKTAQINKSMDVDGFVSCIDHIRRKGKQCIGFCNNHIHKGFLTESLLREHKCIEKKCSFLDRVEDHPYWNRKADKRNCRLQAKSVQKTEQAILEEANRHLEASKQANILVSRKAEAVFCKHVEDSLYILCVINADLLATQGLYQRIRSKLGVKIKIKEIKEWQRRNIELTYIAWLNEETQQRIRQRK